MAVNKFASMLQRNSHKMTVILIYTILEWILIALLLLNALFSYLITKFAAYFGLRPPCLLCSRVDDLFEPPRGLKLFPDLLCEDHVAEISLLGYCPCHRRFRGQGAALCRSCSEDHRWRKPSRVDEEEEEAKDQADAWCSCCGVGLAAAAASASDDEFLVKEPPFEELEGPRVEVQAADGGEAAVPEKEADRESAAPLLPPEVSGRRVHGADACIRSLHRCRECGAVMEGLPVAAELDDADQSGAVTEGVPVPADLADSNDGDQSKEDGRLMEAAGDSSVLAGPEGAVEDKVVDDGGASGGGEETGEGELKRNHESEEDEKTDGEISIGSEICDREHVQHSHLESIPSASEEEAKIDTEGSREASLERMGSLGERFSEHDDGKASDNSGHDSRSISRAQSLDIPDELLGDDDRLDTPRSVDSLHAHKTFTESVDGSVTSEMDSSETLTMDQLKAALLAERKTLRSLYAELEAERRASEESASQTMAMITRLQEEKAAMHMDALQYQRMIEEQSEYEHEEWQMLNELVIARESEKAELEKELEIYRAKVLKYEAKERKLKGITTDETPGTIYEDVEIEEQMHDNEEEQYTPVAAVLSPKADPTSNTKLNDADKFIDKFENDKLAILEQLKILEIKISSVKKEKKSENHKPSVENPDRDISDGTAESHNELHDATTTSGEELGEEKKSLNGKALLPLFDAVAENGDGQMEGLGTSDSDDSDSKLDLDENPLTIEEDVEEIYRKIQDLEADMDFIKLCVSLSKNGDRCMNLLESILEQLTTVRTTEVAVGNESNILIAASA